MRRGAMVAVCGTQEIGAVAPTAAAQNGVGRRIGQRVFFPTQLLTLRIRHKLLHIPTHIPQTIGIRLQLVHNPGLSACVAIVPAMLL